MDYPARAKYCLEELQHLANISTGGGLVVLGVLAVVWLSGLEPLARDLKQLELAFSSLNRGQQITEHELLAVPAQAFLLALEQQRIDAQRQSFLTFPQLERELLDGRASEERVELFRALGRLARSQREFPKAEAALVGKAMNKDLLAEVAKTALQGAEPLAKNAYKIPLTQTLVRRALAKLGGVTA